MTKYQRLVLEHFREGKPVLAKEVPLKDGGTTVVIVLVNKTRPDGNYEGFPIAEVFPSSGVADKTFARVDYPTTENEQYNPWREEESGQEAE
jgi:hypothetical protein